MNILIHCFFCLFLFSSQACKVNKSVDSTNTQPSKAEIIKEKKTYPVKAYTESNNLSEYATAIFAGGCFWCTEAAFERINGVVDVISGYSGGEEEYPDYYGVGEGKTGHAEAIYIYYDKSIIDYGTLLDVFFVAHDPTTLNRQGPDIGAEYRSAIYYENQAELDLIDSRIRALNESQKLAGKVVTEVAPYKEFWVAEEYHQNFYELHPNHGYVNKVSKPKVKKVVKTFPSLVKETYR